MTDDRFMRIALDLAEGHRTHPNPRVGAVVVSESGDVVGKGAHVAAGEAHAEVVALESAGDRAKGGTMYVSLEPCIHHGRTPPCVDTILEAQIATVVVATQDPDPRVAGDGIRRLRESGVTVKEGVLSEEAADLNAAYLHHRQTGLPRVTMKWAMTLDGAVAADDGSSRWISSEQARDDAHGLRAAVDAVVVGAGTVRADDPLLNVRTEGHTGSQPIPIVLAGRDDLPADAAVWSRDPLVIATREIQVPSGTVVVVDETDGLPDPVSTCRAIADVGHLDLLLEGGPTVAGSWWRAGVVLRGVVYVSAKMAGGGGVSPISGAFETIGQAEIVEITAMRRLGPDYRIDFSRK